MKRTTQQLSLLQPDQTATAEQKVVYISPPVEQLDQCAKQICQRLGQILDPTYDTAEMRFELATFLKVTAQMQAKHLNKHAEDGEGVNRTQRKEGSEGENDVT